MSKLVVFTHNDLDALGCVLNIEYKFPNVPKHYFYTNYADIDKQVQEIVKYKNENACTNIVIADVSFSDAKDSLRVLYNEFNKVTHIDHHMYPDGFWDEFPNMQVQWDKAFSATVLCEKYLKNENENLSRLSEIIDVYDLWRTQDPKFNLSQHFNEYFWYRVRTSNNPVSIEQLALEIINKGCKLPDDFVPVTQSIQQKYTNAIQDYESRGLIQRAGEITIALVDDWFNHILISEMQKGKNFVIGANSFGIIRVRINQECPYTNEQIDKVRERLTGNSQYGHQHAFTYKIDGAASFDKLIAEVKKITQVIDEFCV